MICIILGTRPEIIKFSPVIKELQKRKIGFFVIHTGQHYSKSMDEKFFKELQLPNPDYNLHIGSGNHGEQTGKMMLEVEKILIKKKPKIVLVQGDTNTALAGALAAKKLHIKIGHIEAGLRSYSDIPEETNRILIDHCSDFLFAPTKKARNNLRKEGLKSVITGNTIVDSVNDFTTPLKFILDWRALVTIHRPENTDNKKRLREIMKSVAQLNNVVFPLHPRTKKMIAEFRIKIPSSITTLSPLERKGFLSMLKNSSVVITDSGGVQEEACILGIPCITVRESTERPETIHIGANILCEPAGILEAIGKHKKYWSHPYGTGESAKKIITILEDFL